jgi:hypothetical protein
MDPNATNTAADQSAAPAPAPQTTGQAGPQTNTAANTGAGNNTAQQAPRSRLSETPRVQLPLAEPTMRVLDTTAVDGPRIHDMDVKGAIRKFKFEPGVGTEMPATVAAKFLKHAAFTLVDENGNALKYERAPKQPEELQAGETLVLAPHETVARFDELSSRALVQRCAEIPLGEKFALAEKLDRPGMIAFLVDAAAIKRKKNPATSDVASDEFIPEPATGDEAAQFDNFEPV